MLHHMITDLLNSKQTGLKSELPIGQFKTVISFSPNHNFVDWSVAAPSCWKIKLFKLLDYCVIVSQFWLKISWYFATLTDPLINPRLYFSWFLMLLMILGICSPLHAIWFKWFFSFTPYSISTVRYHWNMDSWLKIALETMILDLLLILVSCYFL